MLLNCFCLEDSQAAISYPITYQNHSQWKHEFVLAKSKHFADNSIILMCAQNSLQFLKKFPSHFSYFLTF